MKIRMKRIIILVMVLTLAFPNFCFATIHENPDKAYLDFIKQKNSYVKNIDVKMKANGKSYDTLVNELGDALREDMNFGTTYMGDLYTHQEFKSPEDGNWVIYCELKDDIFSMKAGYLNSKKYPTIEQLEKEDEIVDKVAEQAKHLSPVEKALFIHDYIIANVRYDDSEKDLHYTSCGALVNGKATCYGYSGAFYRIARKAGLGCRIVGCHVEGESYHCWNIVMLYGKWYHIDVTWDDSVLEKYRYFLRGDDYIESVFYHQVSDYYQSSEWLKGHKMSKDDYPFLRLAGGFNMAPLKSMKRR